MRAVVVAAALAGLMPAQVPFKTRADAVRVDVLVLDGNRPVAGLTAEDFELRDAGVPQRVEAVAVEDVPVSVMLALDASASVRGQPLDGLKEAGRAVVDLLGAADRTALLTFAEEVDLLSDWTSDRGQIAGAIARAQAAGSTALHDAAYVALTLRDPQAGRPLVVLFSDGEDTASWLTGASVIDAARRSDVLIYGVGLESSARRAGYLVDFTTGLQPPIPAVVPQQLSRSFLATLAENSGGKYIQVGRSDQLREVFLGIFRELRSRYLLTYIPSVDADGWHPIEVRLKHKRGVVTARRGYLR
jgi:VWFA-related protein